MSDRQRSIERLESAIAELLNRVERFTKPDLSPYDRKGLHTELFASARRYAAAVTELARRER